ncbi:DUF402 domain-containing protein [Sporolactobacillus spathodeae]|uniref:RNA-binding protein associated with RNAse of E/G family n=1 Tax=Sporolactobacillus spathodeae TaxID=1465502 RepID=A0ABS2Q804_9BACL|nr:DUF402 domain-containing protein [Sporolactobacillus spathodeae]MBM7657294.1 putative RNA-binding protein associated with RNAse of E/G family [Sporolactobacillus spathodeae]
MSSGLDQSFGRTIVEKKVYYDGRIKEYPCLLLEANTVQAAVSYRIDANRSLYFGQKELLTIPAGSTTFAFFWTDCPYNVYQWRTKNGEYIGSYINFSKHTQIGEQLISYQDLILDLLALPDGRHYLLDEDELPEPLHVFEKGQVKKVANTLIRQLPDVLQPLINRSALYWEKLSNN